MYIELPKIIQNSHSPFLRWILGCFQEKIVLFPITLCLVKHFLSIILEAMLPNVSEIHNGSEYDYINLYIFYYLLKTIWLE